MAVTKFIAGQLGHPGGLFGSLAAFAWNWRNAALNDTVLDLLLLQPTDRVLDIGFGGGYLLKRMSGVVTAGLLEGVDVSPAIVANAEKRFRKEVRSRLLGLKCASVEALPYPLEHFTKVSSVNSIFYWQDVEQGLREIMRVLVKGGKVVLCFTGRESLEKKGFARHIHIFDAEAVGGLLKTIGFQDILLSTFADKHRKYICITANKSL